MKIIILLQYIHMVVFHMREHSHYLYIYSSNSLLMHEPRTMTNQYHNGIFISRYRLFHNLHKLNVQISKSDDTKLIFIFFNMKWKYKSWNLISRIKNLRSCCIGLKICTFGLDLYQPI